MNEKMFSSSASKFFLFAFMLLFSLAHPLKASNANERLLIISDTASISPETELFTATGNVEVYFNGVKLIAPKVSYHLVSEWVSVDGPFELTDPGGSTTTYGEFAELSPDLAEGVIFAVRRVVDETLNVQAAELKREQGRYTKVKNVRASNCNVCQKSKTPTWQLVASEAVHDSEKKAVTYRHARLLIRGVPVAYIPWVRIPDPTVDRADGFLAPKLKSNSLLGNQVVLPYFKTFGTSSDLTVSPHLTLRQGNEDVPSNNTLEAKYRTVFHSGHMELNGAISHDNLHDKTIRGYLFSNGNINLPSGYKLNFQTQLSSDDTYLGTYKFFSDDRKTFKDDVIFFGKDRLNNHINVTKEEQGEILHFTYEHFNPLLKPDYKYETANSKLNFHWLKSIASDAVPGELRMSTVAQRYGNDFGATNVRQEDTIRVSANFFWHNTFDLEKNTNLKSELGVFADHYRIDDSSTFQQGQSGLSFYVANKLEKNIKLYEKPNYAIKTTPSLGLVAFNLADFEIPTIDDSTVDYIDPFDTAKLDRFHRLDSNQNFNHDLTYLTLGIPLKIDWHNGYYVTSGIRADALIQSDVDYILDDALVYNFGLGKTQGKFQFSAESNFNKEGENIAKSFSFSRSFGKLDLSGRYVFKKEDQEFYIADKREEWALNLSITPFERLNIQVGNFWDTLNSANTFDTASLSFNGNRLSANYSTKYLRTANKFDNQSFSISTDLNEKSEIYFEYEEILEKAERRRVGWSYGNECMQLRADVSNYIDETADRESIDEFSLVLKLGSFGGKAAQRCG